MFEASVSQTPDELHNIVELSIVSISLNSHVIGGTTPQGTTLRAGSTFTRTDGTSSAIYEAVFGNDQTDTIYRGETGQPGWSAAGTIDVKGFGRLTNLAASMANDFDLAELVKTRSAAANDNRILYLKEVA